MKLIVDYANLEKIKEIYMYYPVDGVTTNPSILAKEKRNPYEVLKEIREFISKDGELHVQVTPEPRPRWPAPQRERIPKGHIQRMTHPARR